jgi:hypothetical protein
VSAGRADRIHVAAACGIFLVATLAAFFDVLFVDTASLPSIAGEDLSRIFLYWNDFVFGELRRGHVVLWNPHSFAGAPFLAGFQAGVLYPPNWLHMVLPTTIAINVGIALHVFLAGSFTFLWARRHRLHPASSVLAGLVFMFCGAHFLQLYRGHLPHLHTLVWAPLVFLAIDGVVTTRAVRWPVIGAVAVALQVLAGNVQYVLYTAIVAAAYAAWRWLAAGASWRTAVGLTAIYAGGAALSAVQLFPGIAALPESLRAGLSYVTAAGGALPPENVLTFAVPTLFGDDVAVPYWGRWTLSESSLFVGMAPSLLALYGAARGDRSVARAAFAMTLLALLFAFGDHTPLFRVLYDHVPGFRSVRGIAKFGVLASAFVALLVAVGFDALLRDGRASVRWIVGAALFAVVAGASATWLGADCEAGGARIWNPMLDSSDVFFDARTTFAYDRSQSPIACANTASALRLAAATALGLAGVLAVSRVAPRAVYVVALVGVVELVTYARYAIPRFDATPLLARVEQARAELRSRGATQFRVDSQDPLQYLALAAGGFDVWGSADLVLDRYARFLQATQQWPLEAVLVASGLRRMTPALGMLRLSHRMGLHGDAVTLRASGLDALPRALLVPHWEVHPDRADALAAVMRPGFDPRRTVVLESDPGIAPDPASDGGPARVRDVSTEIMDVDVDVDRPAILLVTDNYSADWRAYAVDDPGRTYAILPANTTLRGIPLPNGRHRIRLEYRPRWFTVGVYVTLMSAAALMAVVALSWRGQRLQRRRSSAA